MGQRPLRQYYDGVTIVVDDDLPLVEPWLRHRRRLLASLHALSDEQWQTHDAVHELGRARGGEPSRHG